VGSSVVRFKYKHEYPVKSPFFIAVQLMRSALYGCAAFTAISKKCHFVQDISYLQPQKRLVSSNALLSNVEVN
jgi:hypothetical protein